MFASLNTLKFVIQSKEIYRIGRVKMVVAVEPCGYEAWSHIQSY
jgi:hypothetical protein